MTPVMKSFCCRVLGVGTICNQPKHIGTKVKLEVTVGDHNKHAPPGTFDELQPNTKTCRDFRLMLKLTLLKLALGGLAMSSVIFGGLIFKQTWREIRSGRLDKEWTEHFGGDVLAIGFIVFLMGFALIALLFKI